MFVRLGYQTVPYAWLVYPALVLLAAAPMFFAKTRVARGAIGENRSRENRSRTCDDVKGPGPIFPGPIFSVTALPAAALVIFFAVLVTANVASGVRPGNLMTLAPMLLMCLLAWRSVPVGVVAGLSVLALGGAWWVGPRALYVLAPIAVWGLLELLARLDEPLWLRSVVPAAVIALAAAAVVDARAEDERVWRYWMCWAEGDVAARGGDEENAEAFYARADASRPHDTFFLYCSIHEMTRLDRMAEVVEDRTPDNAVRCFQFRMPRILRELEEVVNRDPEWATPREDIARLRVLRGEYAPAVEQYRAVVRAQPVNRPAQAMLGYLLLRDDSASPPDSIGTASQSRGNVPQADDVLTRLVERPNPPVEAMVNLGVIRFHQRRDAEARELWERARARRPSHPAADWNLERLSDASTDRRIETRFLAMKPNPGVAPLVHNLAAWGRNLSGADKIRLVIEATQFDPLFADAHRSLAQVYLTPGSPFYNLRLGLWHSRRAEEAARHPRNAAQ